MTVKICFSFLFNRTRRRRSWVLFLLCASLLRTADHVVAEGGPETPEDPLDVTITAEARDEVPVIKTPPPLEIPFSEVVSLSREGQTDQALSQPVEHMTRSQHIKLVEINSRQTVEPLLVQIPAPPLVRMEIPPGVLPADWKFQVVDQNSKTVLEREGTLLPTGAFMEWDGYDQGLFKILVGPAYSPVLVLREPSGTRRHYGEPLQWDVLQYEQDGLLQVEFNNDRLYEKNTDQFSKDMLPFLQSALDIMRKRIGTPFRLIIYEKPGSAPLAQKRLERWKKFLREQLVIDTEEITLVTMTPKERGRVTSVMMLAEP